MSRCVCVQFVCLYLCACVYFSVYFGMLYLAFYLTFALCEVRECAFQKTQNIILFFKCLSECKK